MPPARHLLATLVGALITLAPLPAQTTEARDTVTMFDGKVLRGRVLRFDRDEVVLRVGSVDRKIPRKQVRSFSSIAVDQRDVLDQWHAASTTDADAMLALAGTAEQRGLPHEARVFRWYAALQRPADAAIHRALGNKERNGEFLVQIDDAWVPFASADARGADFDDAWRLRSEHFTIRCAGGLRVGLDTLMELETLYWTFMDLFGRDLALLELVEPIDVRLYRSREQMPNLANTVGAYFSTSEPALFTCVENGRPYALMHEGTHALLHWFFVRAAKSRGDLPAWLDEGWAEYMSGRLQTRVPGKPVRLDASVQSAHMSALAAAQASGDLYGVHRLLNFKSSDFSASTRQDAKYAQSWALFRWLYEHHDPELRALFVKFLKEAAAGQGQASTFRRMFARHERDLETRPWQR